MKFIEKLSNETYPVESICDTQAGSCSTFICDSRWDSNRETQAKILKLIIDSPNLDENGEGGTMTVDIEPIRFGIHDRCYGDYDFCVSPYFTIRKIESNKVLVDVFNFERELIDEDTHQKYYKANKVLYKSFEYLFSDEELREIKNSSLYRLNISLEKKTNAEIAQELAVIMEEEGCDKYEARNEMISTYDAEQQGLNRITWVMYQLPMEVLAKSHIAVELSQNDKLFRIENIH